MSEAPPFEHAEATIAELGDAMATGALAARALTESYLERIDAVDPMLRSVIQTNPEALEIAEALDAELGSSGPRGPLHGIPILVKDNIDTADRMRTSAGSFALGEVTPATDAFIVRRLRDAGAVILGKANLSEWANFRSTRSTSGWSARGGQGRNPYALDRSPCGSSSGSAGAVSANLCVASVGTETDGSILCPSGTCGIVGIKPTVGLISRSGVIPISHTQDTPGPLARTVADAAFMLAALAGIDEQNDNAPGARTLPDYASFVDPDGLRGARIGVARNLAGFHDRVDRVFERALETTRGLGAELVDPVEVPHASELEEPELEVLLHEFKMDLETYLRALGGEQAPRTLADLIAFNREHADLEMPFFGQELFEQASERGPLTEPVYLDALATCRRLARTEGLDAAFAEHRVEALVAPTNGPAWLIDHVNGDHHLGGNSTPAAVAGYPAITVPAGSAFGMPVGISFIGPAWSEGRLIRFASSFERETSHRSPPVFPSTVTDPA
jgi:amidase